MTDNETILFEVTDGLAHLTLNRPASLNAIDPAAARRWRDLAREIAERDDVRAVLLDANGPAFCAGGDVLQMAGMGDGTAGSTGAFVAELADVIHEGHRTLQSVSKPIVAAVQGAVAGGGLGFMLVADVIIAADRAKFVSKYADIGLTPDCGVSTLLPEAVGMRRALELMLSPRLLSAAEALDWGLVTEVVPAEHLDARAREVAAFWLGGATAAFGQARRLLREGVGRSFQEALDDEAQTIGTAIETPESVARIAAFAASSSKRGDAPGHARGPGEGPRPAGGREADQGRANDVPAPDAARETETKEQHA